MTAASSGTGFSIGGVFSRSMEIFKRNFVSFFILMAVFQTAIIVLQALLGIPLSPSVEITEEQLGALGIGYVVVVILSMVCFSAVYCAMIFGTYADLAGQRPSLGDMLSKPMGRLLPLIGLYFVFSIAVGIGFLLLIVPGVWLLCRWYLSASALVTEKIGVFASLTRSAELTAGHRWPILAIVVLQVVILFVAGIVISLVALLAVAIGGVIGYVIASIAIYSVIYPFITVVAVVVYYDIRAAKEGITANEVARVFD